MPLESTQIMCTVLWANSIPAPYRATHKKHPCVLWVGSNKTRWEWHALYTQVLFFSYSARYGRNHGAEAAYQTCRQRAREKLTLPEGELLPFPKCVPTQYQHLDSVAAYRAYYISDKKAIARWNYGDAPAWWLT